MTRTSKEEERARLNRKCKEQEEENNLESQRRKRKKTCNKITSYAESDATFLFEPISTFNAHAIIPRKGPVTVGGKIDGKRKKESSENKSDRKKIKNGDPNQ